MILSAAAGFLFCFFGLSQGLAWAWALFSSCVFCGSALDLGLNFVWESSEGLFDVDCVLGRCFEELNAQRLGQSFSFFGLDLSVGLKIGFVTNKKLDNVFVSVLVDFGKPVLNILERLSVSDIVDEDDTMGTLVIRSSDGFKSLLSGGVPDLKFDGVSSSFEGSDLEIDTDGGQEAEINEENTFHWKCCQRIWGGDWIYRQKSFRWGGAWISSRNLGSCFWIFKS